MKIFFTLHQEEPCLDGGLGKSNCKTLARNHLLELI